MKKLMSLVVAAASLMVILSGCGKPTLTVSNHHLSANALAVTLKGKSNQKQVDYTVNGGTKQTVKTNSGAFVISVPTKNYQQTVKLSTDGKHQTVTVAKANVVGSYQKMRTTYNQGLTGAALPKKEAAELKAGKATSMVAMQAKAQKATALQKQAAELKQTQAKLAPAMKKAKASVKDQLLPANPKDGIHNLIDTNKMTLRVNLSGDKVLGIAMMVPVNSLKHKKDLKPFIMSFSILTNSVGANAKHVLNKFQKAAKAKKSSSTTAPKFHSSGLLFSLGYSTSTLYVFITK
ncbi:hypothetical protein [Lentilactobacillus buchneri]|uniref:hypothetical protein n=1 Tax=Lentilactobacillus buchneri TaxID=1581 RepID=UPI0021A30A68|nr:hypothetical protein [Lentilactobacillus buchneri]MCT2881623.1 hypothetical protein [Lentilactobacillus buchneri]